jgi:hypothetical protein
MNEQDEADLGVKKADLSPPTWKDDAGADFEYLGMY